MTQYRGPRYYTNKLLEMIDDGLVDPEIALAGCLSWMSEDDVEGMMRANEFDMGDDEDDEQDEDE